MGWLSRFFRLERKASASLTYGDINNIWADLLGGGRAKSGPVVNWQSALKVTTVLACTRRIAEALTVPCKVYRRDPGTKNREEARDHPLYDLLSVAPNEWQSGYEYRETIAFHAALTGNHFSFINRINSKLAELIPIEPGRVTVRRNNDYSLTYRITALDGSYGEFSSEDVWHVRGPSWDMACGLDAVRLTREAIGLAMATEETHAQLHANGVRPSGLYSVDGNLDEAGLVRLAAWIKQSWSGLDNVGRTLIGDRAAKWTQFEMKGVDAQHLETRNMQVEEICRGMLVMPIMVGYADKTATYASAEQMFLAHLVHTVRPWHDRVAESADRWLLTKEERAAGLYVGFVDAAFLRPDMKTKAEYNRTALGGSGNPGWLTINDVRGFDELPKIDGGDRIYVPTNATPIGDDGLPMPVKRDPNAQFNGGQSDGSA